MQKKMIALAIAGLASSAALAQTQVTLYGVADAGQAWVKGEGRGPNNDQKRVGRLDSNSSLLGFKGTEDLGNGLKAIFQMETQLDISNGSGFIGGRDTYVGLGGNFGTVLGGILTHPMRLMGAKVDILPGAAGFGTTAAVTGQISGLGVHTGADDRATNTLAYITPIFGGGFSATAAYINGESRVEDNNAPKVNAKAWQIAGQYDNGPLYVALAYHKTTDMLNQQHPALNANCGSACSAIGAGLDATVWRVAGIYTAPFGTRFSALYDHTKLDRSDVNETTLKRSAWSLGVAHTFGNNTLGLQYARSGDTSVSGGPDFNDSTRIWTLAYQYALSKRTMLQARYSDLKNDRDGKSNFYLNSVANNGQNVAGGGAKYSGFMVGVRHTF